MTIGGAWFSIVQIEIMTQSLLQHLLNRRSMVFYVSRERPCFSCCYNIMMIGGAWFPISLMESFLRLSVQPHDKRGTLYHTQAAISHNDNKRSMVFYSTKGDQNLAELKYIPCYNYRCRFQSTNRTMLELLL